MNPTQASVRQATYISIEAVIKGSSKSSLVGLNKKMLM